MSDGVIDPAAIPIPPVEPDEVEAAGRALKGDGEDIAQAGQDIKSAWGGLEGNYIAPEADILLAAVDPVATAGDDFGSATGTVGDALIAFAEEVRPILARLRTLKADAQTFRDDIDGDDDWRENEDKVNEHNALNNDVLAALNDYQVAERTCANAITAIFGGTTFVALDPNGETLLGEGQEGYGFTEAPRDVETPWATPQEYDAPWYEDAWNGIADFGVGIAEDVAGLVGLYGENGWGVSSWSEWGDNLADNYGGMLEGFGALAGFYGENGWGVGSFGEWWGNFSTGWTEFAHAIVPWREWGDRPGYVITQSVLNIGSMFVGAGVVKGLIQGGRRAGGGPDVDADAPDAPSRLDADQLPGGQRPEDMPSTRELSEALDGLDIDSGRLDGLDEALDDAAGLSERQPAPVGGGELPDGDGPDRPSGSGDGPSEPLPPSPESPDSGDSPSDRGDSPPADETPAPDRTPTDETGDTGDRLPDDDGRSPDDSGPRDDVPADQPGDRPGDRDGDQDVETSPDADADRPADDRPDRTEGSDDDAPGRGDSETESQGQDERPRRPRAGGSDGLGVDPREYERPEYADMDSDAPDAPDSEAPSNQAPDNDAADSSGATNGDSDSGRFDGPVGETQRGYYDAQARFVREGFTDETGRYFDGDGNVFAEPPQSRQAAHDYRTIREMEGDTQRISDHTGIDQDLLDRVKDHLFYREHDVARGPNDSVTALFTPMTHVGDLWLKAERGELSPTEAMDFRRLIMHEGVESALMDEGVPFRLTDPGYYDEYEYPAVSPEYRAAHDLAPGENGDPFGLYESMGIERPDFEFAPDLSNLDELVDYILGEIR
ncbi:hypothetical protein [Marinactinospora rubrisoli]|uniref:Uncharacterized protein n=1 Tax=Marinactinospora rubrisoli TaxID=2715399 RepID=A0ABW2KL59_9ACTN